MVTRLKKEGNPPLRTMYDFSILRDLRKRAGLTLADVTQSSGISGAVISKLERNQSSAELATLFKLSRVFGMSATDLIALAESRTAHKKKAKSHDSGGFRFDEISYGNCRCLVGKAAQGARISRPEIHGDDYEVCWVRRGRVAIMLPNEKYELAVGDAVQFDAILEHTYAALEDCEIIILHLRKGKRF